MPDHRDSTTPIHEVHKWFKQAKEHMRDNNEDPESLVRYEVRLLLRKSGQKDRIVGPFK